jgi:hypothetical protein
MGELLPHLLARGINGRASGSDLRVLELLANPRVNVRVFGQPLPEVLSYYWREYVCLILASERFAGGKRSGEEAPV